MISALFLGCCLSLLVGRVTAEAAMRPDLGCRASGLCSVGHPSFFKGDISKKGVLRSALEAVSYKKEIVIAITMGHTHMEMMMHLRQDFLDLGMAHFLALSTEVKHCDSIWTLAAEQSCVWDKSPIIEQEKKGFHVFVHLTFLRLRFIARATRMGYNVMSLDSDYHITQDPYVYFKRPPLRDLHMFASAEWHCGINTGFLYVQNVHPDGPISWLFRHVTEVRLRWMDDAFAMLDSWGVMKLTNRLCLIFDQAWMDDALHSAMTGVPMSVKGTERCVPDGAGADSAWARVSGSNVSKEEAMNNQRAVATCRLQQETVPPPSDWPETIFPAGARDRPYTAMYTMDLMVPNTKDDHFAPELGGRFMPVERGNYSLSFMQQLKDDCPDCPWWPDTKASDYELAHSIKEKFCFVPRWLACSAWELRHGYNTPLDGSKPRTVMIHSHAMPGISPHTKLAVRRVYGKFHYNLSAEINAKAELRPKGPYLLGSVPPAHVLAISPTVLLRHTANEVEMKIIMMGLMQLAMLSNRTLVFPDPPCEAGWMLTDKDTSACDGSRGLEMTSKELMPYAALVNPAGDPSGKRAFRFANPFSFHPSCIRERLAVDKAVSRYSAMLNVEFEQRWLPHDAPPGTRKEAADENTAFKATDKLRVPSDPSSTNWSLGEVIVSLPVADAMAELRRFDKEALLYVAHPVVVDLLAAQQNNWSAIELLSEEDQSTIQNATLCFTLFAKECTAAWLDPWDYSSKAHGKLEHAVGRSGFMRDNVVHVHEGATFAGRLKP